MVKKRIEKLLNGALDDLASIEHERWSHWQKYVHSKGTRQADGSLVLPVDLVEQWERQIVTPYADLSDKEKESDREQVRRYLPTVVKVLSTL